VFLGGSFSSVNAVPRRGLAGIDSRGRLLPSHPQVVEGPRDQGVEVTALLASGKTLYVGGGFGRIDDQPRSQLAAFALPSLRLLPWHPRVGSEEIFEGITALAASDGALYAAGDFDSVNGVERDAGVAAVDLASGKTLPLNPSPHEVGIPEALAVTGPKVFIGGNPSVDALPFATVDRERGAPLEWKGGLGFRTDVVEEVRALAIADGSLYASGSYLPDYGVARMDLDDGHPLPLSLHARSAFPDYALDGMISDGRNVYVRLKSGRVAVIDGRNGHVRSWVRVCPIDDVEPRIAVTESRVIVNCSAAGGGERLVVVPFGH
jgi:hypothetical protein